MRRLTRLAAGALVVATLSGGGGVARADVFTNVPEAAGLQLVHELEIPATSANWNISPVPYAVDDSALVTGPFDRIAYYMELDSGSGPQFVYVSMAPFTTDAGKIGVPASSTGAAFQHLLTDMNVVSNVPGIVTGEGITTGNIEFWASNYGQANSSGVPGASATLWDFGDTGGTSEPGYGSMQIHNHGAQQTLFAYNRWGVAGPSDLGIGNNPGEHPDWTFEANSGAYVSRKLQVLVRPVDVTVFDRVPEAAGYELLYSLTIPNYPGSFHARPVPYWTNAAADLVAPFDRVAYYLELDNGSGPQFAFASMDAFTEDSYQLGLPVFPPGNSFQREVANLDVFSNVPGVVTGTGLAGGNIEMWGGNYIPPNGGGVPGASDSVYDFGDQPSDPPAGYGSFQIHNHAAGQTVLAYNRWGGGGASDVGIGNNPSGHPDWTFAQNAGAYTTKVLHVLVRPVAPLEAVLTESSGTTAVEEGGAGDTIEIVLSRQPAADVSVTFAPVAERNGGDIDLGAGAGSPVTVLFAPALWDQPQVVHVSAVDDAHPELAQNARIEFSASSADSDFDGRYVPPIDVLVTDNDGTPTIKIFLLGGQSNMVGLGKAADLPPAFQQQQEDVPIFFGSSWGNLRPGLGQEFGPELSFGRDLADAMPDTPVALVKYAVGATNLHTQWAPPIGLMYLAFLQTYNAALASIDAQIGPFNHEVAGMIWMQGESDSFAPYHLAYEQNLTGFIATIRSVVGEPEMPFIIGQISEHPGWVEGATVRQAQASVAAADPFARLVITSDLALIPGDVHYDSGANLELGSRFAQEMLLLTPQGSSGWMLRGRRPD